eukprot:TRINITY_DN31940_c0_g1_i1.p1 TRINITY_DN31940_c0_g1~~TRINITY_DN31940_c0_g1_i1.p1  ORF type:complete len:934 (+),score=200.98 TRINITY_DN31940_c0_g1_i1:358-2802(+)
MASRRGTNVAPLGSVNASSTGNLAKGSGLGEDFLDEYVPEAVVTRDGGSRGGGGGGVGALSRHSGYSGGSQAGHPKASSSNSAPPSRSVTPPPGMGGVGGGSFSSAVSQEPCEAVGGQMTIPTLPSGRVLLVNCISTWGDMHYIGLNGIELFDAFGNEIVVDSPSVQVTGAPDSINVLPEYTDDPRVASNVFNGANRTCDDRNVWLAPFTPGGDHTITVDLGVTQRISMIRVWNYNKSRPHSERGVREVEFYLDGAPIFGGEVSKAPGMLDGCEDCAETILFTADDSIVSKIDATLLRQMEVWRAEDERAKQAGVRCSTTFNSTLERPPTSQGRSGERPATMARRVGGNPFAGGGLNAGSSVSLSSHDVPRGTSVKISVVGNWGDILHVGCGKIAFATSALAIMPTEKISGIRVSSRVTGVLRGSTRTFDATSPKGVAPSDLPDLISVMFSSEPPRASPDTSFCGWHVPCGDDALCEITVTLREKVSISGVIFMNYNESLASTSRGVKRVEIQVGGKPVTPSGGVYVRKAPGNEDIEYSQTVPLSVNPTDKISQTVTYSTLNKEVADALHRARVASKPFPTALLDQLGFEPVMLPVGHVFRLELTSTLGDNHYIGLNGLEMYDVYNERIPISPESLQAVPRDVTILPQNASDCRTLQNLVSGDNLSAEDHNIWLCPFSPGAVNLLYVVFEDPVALSRITLYNYSKTPARGVGQVSVYADDTLVYSGCLRPAPANPASPNFPQHMIFTTTPPQDLDLTKAVPAAQQQEPQGGVVFYDSGRIDSLDLENMPRTSCRRPPEWQMRNMKGNRAAGFKG